MDVVSVASEDVGSVSIAMGLDVEACFNRQDFSASSWSLDDSELCSLLKGSEMYLKARKGSHVNVVALEAS